MHQRAVVRFVRPGFAIALAVLMLVVACSSSSQPGGREAPPDASVGPVVRQLVGAGGGKVTSADQRLTIEIPPGALASDVEIRIAAVAAPPADAVGPAYDIQPDGLAFATPALLEYRFEPKDVTEEFRGTRPGFVSNGSWESLPYAWLDYTTPAAYALTDHLSIHGCFRIRDQASNGPPADPPRCSDAPLANRVYVCKPEAYQRCCRDNDGVAGPGCICTRVGVYWDPISCNQNWRRTYDSFWGLVDCHARAGGSGMDGYRCSEDWMKCCRQARGIGPLGGYSPSGVAAQQEPSCVCDLGCGSTIPWQDIMDKNQFRACVAAAARKATPAGPDPRCFAPPDAGPSDAGGDGTTVTVEGGGTCSRTTTADAPAGSVTSASGVAAANPSRGAPSLDLTTLQGGYAEIGGTGALQLHLTDYTPACGYAMNGLDKLSGKELWFNVYASNVTATTYSGQFWVQNRNTTQPGTTVGACTPPGRTDGFPVDSGSITITAIDATHVAGSFNIVFGGQALTASFDVPTCTRGTGLNPPTCCVP
jgi:hypothetical protein